MITPEEQILLNNLNKARAKAEATKDMPNPCTPESHKALVDVIVQQTDVSLLVYKKQDVLIDKLNAYMDLQANAMGRWSIPKNWNEVAKLFIVKSPIPFAVIIVAIICWFMYSKFDPKDLAKATEKEVASRMVGGNG